MIDKLEFLNDFQLHLINSTYGTQKWWTKYLFHFTDITNAISILELGSIYSREKAIELGLMKNDNANNSVITNTSSLHKKYARLYFGPSTPTQYSNEGIRPKEYINQNAHCPIPIMFVFDFIKVFMLDEVKFTDGNLATSPNIFDDIKDLKKLNFNLIYHRTWFNQQNRDKIINARHSEVLVKDNLPLQNNLSVLVVRSEAERETLLYQMSDISKQIYQNKIFIEPKTGIFINEWFYINSVAIINNNIYIKWHYCIKISCNNKFKLKIVLKRVDGNIEKSLTKEDWYPTSDMSIALPKDFQNQIIELSIMIDDRNTYINSFDVEKF